MTNSMRKETGMTKAKFLMGSALTVLALMGAGGAQAQNSPAVETVVVTGTNIRGAAPVGANVVTFDAADIQATGATSTQELLTNIPALTTFGDQGAGSNARGGIGTADASGSSAPTIHALGASASNQTLILVDGHRVPLAGLSHTLSDPSMIAPDAIARIEVLPDGSSAIYGSDASAGVVNIITRKNYSGLEANAQYGFADGYQRQAFGLAFGKTWDDGGMMLAYNYEGNSHLLVTDRDFLRNDLRSRGGANLASYNCSPATIASSSAATANVYLYPYTSLYGTVNNTSIAPCDRRTNGNTSLNIVPAELRHNLLLSVTQSFGDRLSTSVDFGFSNHLISTVTSRGTLTGTAFGPGSNAPLGSGQINPFYQNGISGLTSETVRYDFDALFGPGAHTKGGSLDTFVTLGADYKAFGDWLVTLGATVGLDNSFQKSIDTVNTAEAFLALNGSVNAGGTATSTAATTAAADPYGLGTDVAVTRLPLTTANALDVWNPVGSNRTSQSVRNSLLDNQTAGYAQQMLNDIVLKTNGSLFSLPAGDIKVAGGLEYVMNNYQYYNTGTNATGPTSGSGAKLTVFHAGRFDYAQFLEFLIPVIGPDAGVPLIQKLDLDISGRHDHYSSFGDTSNPKVSIGWTIVDGLKARGSYGTSFTAPALTSLPGGYGPNGAGSSTGGNVTVPASHLNAPGSFCAAGCVLTTAFPGVTLNGPGDHNSPETALTYSAGLDLDAGAFGIPGLRASATYWWNKSKGLLTTPSFANEAQVPGLQHLLSLAPPGGWTPTSPFVLAATQGYPQTSAFPSTIYYIERNLLINAFDIYADGMDWDASYAFSTADAGDFVIDLAGSNKFRFDEDNGPGTPVVRFLNGYNVNTTFSAMAFTGRLSVNWHLDPLTVNLAVNYINPYLFQTANPPNNLPSAGTAAGFQHIHASYPVELHLSYDLPTDLFTGSGMQAQLTVNNLFGQKPPFYNSGLGYDPDNANPMGRLVLVGLRKKF